MFLVYCVGTLEIMYVSYLLFVQCIAVSFMFVYTFSQTNILSILKYD